MTEPSVPVNPPRAARSRPPVFAAEWPFKWPFKKKAKADDATTDPFIGYGAEEQRRMALQLAGPQSAQAARSPGNAPPYPWPQPVDSHSHLPLASTWARAGSAGATAGVPAAQPSNAANLLASTSSAPAQQLSGPTATGPPPNTSVNPTSPIAAPVATAHNYPSTAPAGPNGSHPIGSPPPVANGASGQPLPVQPVPATQIAATQIPPATQIPIAPPPLRQQVGRGELEETSRVLAIVGDQSILYGDIAGQINEMLAPYEGQVPQEQLDAQRELLVQKSLPQIVDNKLVFLDFLRQIPPDKMPEIEQDIFREYNKSQLPKLLEKTGLKTAAELDDYLRGMDSSLSKQQRLFLEQVMRHESVSRNVTVDKEVTHEELINYYREHSADFEFQAKVRWERLMVLKSKFSSDKEAHQALAKLGNEVLRGAPLEAVAKRSSHGPNASEGGQYDWTTKGSLRSQRIDQLIFTLPAGKLSRIIEDEEGYHIVRVLERIDAGKQQFAEVQEIIKDKIREQRFDDEAKRYLDRLRKETHVWMATDPSSGAVMPAGFNRGQ